MLKEFLIGVTLFSNVNLTNNVNPSWIVHGPLLCDASETYQFLSNNEIKKAYNDNSYYEGYINEERFGVYATDSTGSQVKISPLTSWSDSSNLGANGKTQVRIHQYSDLPSEVSFNDDSRKLNELDSSLNTDFDVKIGQGKILYSSTGLNSNFTKWDGYMDLYDNVVLNFESNRSIQIAIIYELKENSDGKWYLFHSDHYYHVLGLYSFISVE